MGQLRNVLRGVAWTLENGSPGAVLARWTAPLEGLAVGTYATALLARVVVMAPLQWSNAGHPPPVADRGPTARARLLEAVPDPLLGLGRTARAADHVVALVARLHGGLLHRRH